MVLLPGAPDPGGPEPTDPKDRSRSGRETLRLITCKTGGSMGTWPERQSTKAKRPIPCPNGPDTLKP
eukprot:5555496-Alexandrium_andersonii.AAC.1